ncbi:unnamed protein product, partial [Discosporangium mesarthrocarpum]
MCKMLRGLASLAGGSPRAAVAELEESLELGGPGSRHATLCLASILAFSVAKERGCPCSRADTRRSPPAASRGTHRAGEGVPDGPGAGGVSGHRAGEWPLLREEGRLRELLRILAFE